MKTFFGGVRLSAWALACAAVCCAPAQRGETAAPESKDVAGASVELRQARAAREAAQALHAPTPPAKVDRASALDYLRGPFREWLVARRALSDTAAKAYSEARATGTAQEAVSLLEVGQLWHSFADEAEAGIRATVPPEFAANAQTKALYLESTTGALQPVFALAATALQRCVTVAERSGQSGTQSACAEQLARLPKSLSGATDHQDSSTTGPTDSGPKHRPPERPKLAASQSSPCVFAGSLEPGKQFAVWSDAGGRMQAARPSRLDVSALTPSDAEGGAAKASVVWPIQGTYWLDAKTLPIVLRARQELVKDHVWLDAGTPVRAHHVSAGRVQVDRFRAWTAGSEPAFSQTMPCSELALAGNVERPEHEPGRDQQVSFQGLVELSASRGGPRIARLQLSKAAAFEVLAERRPWRRIVAQAGDWDLPFAFDAWTKTPPSGEPEFGMIGLLNPVDVTHVSTAPLPLFAVPGAQSACATLAKNVWFSAGKVVDGFVPITTQAVWGPKTAEFWVRQGALSKGARSLAP